MAMTRWCFGFLKRRSDYSSVSVKYPGYGHDLRRCHLPLEPAHPLCQRQLLDQSPSGLLVRRRRHRHQQWIFSVTWDRQAGNP
jgi:hypothetical protein